METYAILEYELIPGFRQTSKLLLVRSEEQIYRKKYNRNGIIYYQCYNRFCKASAIVEFNSSRYCNRKRNSTNVHNHDSQKDLIKKLELLNSIKNECKTASLKRTGVREIYDEECKKFKDSAHLVEFGTIRRQLLNLRQKEYPKAPMCFEDVIAVFQNESVSKEFGMSKHVEDKKFYIDTIITEQFSYSVFASPTIVNVIKDMQVLESRNYIADSTFNIVPVSNEFKQLLIIHIQHSDHAFPFIYLLMSNKSERAYTHALQYINANVLNLNPTSVVTDFEFSLRNAIKHVFPAVQLKSCWFHYTNALRRKASKIPNFIRNLNKDKQAKSIFHKFLILPLLKPTDIKEAFKILEKDAINLKDTTKEHMDRSSLLKEFLNYYRRQWMKKERPENFSIYKEPITTSSSAESFHSQLRAKLPKKGSFYRCLDILTDIDATKSIDFLKSIGGCTSLYKTKQKRFKTRSNFVRERLHLLHQKKLH